MQGGRCRERVVATEGNPHVPATPLERKCLAIDIPYNPDWPACEGVEPGCTHYVEGLRPPLGSRMLACLQAKSGKRAICEHGVVGACVQAAVASTPVREDARVACGRIAAHCGETGKSLDAADCGRLLSSIGECRILGWATSCMVERCEVRGCVDDPW
jgi:hypothetical protein